MSDNSATLIVAVYPERGLAFEDFEILDDQPLGDELEIVDLAMVFKDDRGRVRVSNRARRSRRRGAVPRRHRMVLDSRRGLLRRDLVDVGETLESSSAAVIAVARGTGAEKLSSVLHCTDLVLNQIKQVDLAFRRLIAQHAKQSSAYATIRV